MLDDISTYPNLQAEDDGFLIHIRDDIVLPHLPSLRMADSDSLLECTRKLLESNECAAGSGASLPFYEPVFDDEGSIRGTRAHAVWSGRRIDVPLYGDLCKNDVERLILGETITPASPCDEFMSYSPAFRVALLVHHICQMVLINPLAAQAFILGRYKDLGISDSHYEMWGVPATELICINQTHGLCSEWMASSPSQYMCSHGLEPHINGWNIRIRGAMPKREVFVDIWKETRSILAAPKELSFTIDRKKMKHLDTGRNPKKRKRVGDPDVALMCKWVDSNLASGTFPMRGTRMNWQEAVAKFSSSHDTLADRWTADSMRKAYQHHKSLG